MHKFILAAASLLAFESAACAAQPAGALHLRLVPFPKEIERQTGEFALSGGLILQASKSQQELFAQLLNTELQRAGLDPVSSRALDSTNAGFRLDAAGATLELPKPPPTNSTEAYTLEVRPEGIVCASRESAGALYGLQTLRQLIRANRHENRLPVVTIRDWPSLRWRGFQDDMTRGPSSKLQTLEAEAALGAALKLNLMTYYMEYQFEFKKHPQIGPTNGSLTAEDLSAWVAYARPLHVEILGNQQSFGHFGQNLKHPELAALRETADVLTPVREESYQLLDDFYSEVCPRLPFPWFNVCCDETYGLGTGPSRDLAAKIGVGGVYARHLRRIHDLLRDKYQKRMMMWGDIILQHPANLADIPKDTIMLSWGYDARPSFEDQILPFARSGYEFFVCPGVNNWSRILPDFGVAVTNIHNFVRDGAKHGALGMIDTDWEDDGEAINAVKWHADAWAAECAWNASATPYADFNRRIGAVLFGESGDGFGQAIELLTQLHRQPAMKGLFNARFWQNDFAPKTNAAAIELAVSNTLAVVRPAIEHLEACKSEARANEQVLDAILFGARRTELIATRMADGLEAAQLYAQVYNASSRSASDQAASKGSREPIPGATLLKLNRVEQLIRRNRDAHEALGKTFLTLWLNENKTYALDWTLARYAKIVSEYGVMLGRVAAARSALLAHVPLPSPREVGLAIPHPPEP